MSEEEDILERHVQRCTRTAMLGCPLCVNWALREFNRENEQRAAIRAAKRETEREP